MTELIATEAKTARQELADIFSKRATARQLAEKLDPLLAPENFAKRRQMWAVVARKCSVICEPDGLRPFLNAFKDRAFGRSHHPTTIARADAFLSGLEASAA